jgi:phosphate transport system substrate-binding protein
MNRYALLAGATLVATACSSGTKEGSAGTTTGAAASATTTASTANLTGAGSTFIYPLFSRWFSEYASQTGVKVNYQSIGSGGGIRQLSEQTVDFGDSDAPMTDAELAKAKGGPILQFPIVLGAVVVTYNLPQLKAPLRLTGPVLGDIYLGGITKWNDARIAALNPGVQLPGNDILVAHRSDGSGTTYIFTDYLSTVSPAWKSGPGTGKDVQWPVGIGGKGNEGVAGSVKQTPGAIGYIELAYAKQNALPYAMIQNASGAWVAPSIASVTADAAGVADTLSASSDYRISVVNGSAKEAYPISSMTWMLVYRNQPNATRGKALVNLMRWMYQTAYRDAESLDYAPLPQKMRDALVQRLSQINVGAGK